MNGPMYGPMNQLTDQWTNERLLSQCNERARVCVCVPVLLASVL